MLANITAAKAGISKIRTKVMMFGGVKILPFIYVVFLKKCLGDNADNEINLKQKFFAETKNLAAQDKNAYLK
jgi:hypothetical protein